jgi:hypothetical protein
MTMKPTALASLAALTLIIAACGSAKDDDKSTKPGNQANAAADYDEQLTGSETTAQVDDAISGAVEEDDQAQASALALAGWDGNVEAKRLRECKVDGDKAVVEIKQSFEKEREAKGKFRSGSLSYKSLSDRTRTWSKDGTQVACADDGKHAAIDLAKIEGMRLDVSVTIERSRTWHVENLKSGKTFDANMTRSMTGTRHVAWTSAKTEGDVLTLAKTISLSGERKMDATNKGGQQISMERSVKTKDDAPLMVEVQRNATSKAVIQRTLKSGTIVASGKDGGRIETSFADVVYKKADGCVASSGKISGALFDAGADVARVTFTVDLDSQTIVYSDGRTVDYSADGCELDNPDDAEEESSAADMPEHAF